MNLKRILTLSLALILLLGALKPVPAARAANTNEDLYIPTTAEETEAEDPREVLPYEAEWLSQRWPVEILYEEEVYSSQLRDGTAYLFAGNVTLILDQDRDCGPLVSDGSMTIRGEATLRSPILRCEDYFSLESGALVVPETWDTCDELFLINGVFTTGHVGISGGQLESPLLRGIDGVDVIGGEVDADISSIEFYSQTGGQVKASIDVRMSGIHISGGSLETYSLRSGEFTPEEDAYTREGHANISGGTVLYHCSPETLPRGLYVIFPAVITEPAPGAEDFDHLLITSLDTKTPFKDVPKGCFYTKPVAWGYNTNVVRGVGPDRFGPDENCTRAQAVTFLWRASGSPEPDSTENPFRDVPMGEWYTKAILWAAEKGITKGTTTDSFSPSELCTRAQIVTFLWRCAGSEQWEWMDAPDYVDVKPDSFYFQAVKWADYTGVTTGVGEGLFAPNRLCTRGQIVTFLYRYFDQTYSSRYFSSFPDPNNAP